MVFVATAEARPPEMARASSATAPSGPHTGGRSRSRSSSSRGFPSSKHLPTASSRLPHGLVSNRLLRAISMTRSSTSGALARLIGRRSRISRSSRTKLARAIHPETALGLRLPRPARHRQPRIAAACETVVRMVAACPSP